VTISSAESKICGEQIRKKLFSVLKKDDRLREVIKGDKRRAIRKVFEKKLYHCILSSDLSAATDKIPHNLVKAYCQGIRESEILSSRECDILEALTGKQRLIYPDEQVDSLTGILMGHPTSWVMLNLMHLHWIDYATSHDRAQSRSCCICGDDLLGNWSRRTTEKYHEILEACGGSISAKKHKINRGTGVFCEEKFAVDRSNGRIKFTKAIPYASLLTKCSVKTVVDRSSEWGGPLTWFSLAKEYRRIKAENPFLSSRIKRVYES